jgi:mevalonate kinase
MVARLRGLGALGAKLTGAGGDGGAVIGLFPEPEPAVVKLRKEGIDCFASQLAGPRTL